MKNRERKATLKDVAALSGVSLISASRVMSGAPNISAELRRKVEAAASELGYTRNRIAGSLRGKVSDLIAVIVPSMSNNVFPNVVDGIAESLEGSGYRQVLGMSKYSDEVEETILRDLLSWNPAGIIVSGMEHSKGAASLLRQFAGPVIEVIDTDGTAIDMAVGTSQRKAGILMARHFFSQGYRRIGYVGAWGERPQRSRKRRLAFESELAENGITLEACVIRDEASSLSTGAAGLADLLRLAPDLDAVFFANDDLALGALFYCQEQNISVPGQLALAGFNALDMCQFIKPRLTTIATPRHQMGLLAGDLILRRINGEDAPSRVHELPLELYVGETA